MDGRNRVAIRAAVRRHAQVKGILLAGGLGTRLAPITFAVNKHLLPIFDKPLVYYPLATLMQAGIREILLIATPRDHALFVDLLGDGRHLGLHLSYAIQPSPDGLAQALLLGRSFIGPGSCALILGDNIFHGGNLAAVLSAASRMDAGATIVATEVVDPERYGVVSFDTQWKALTLEEKPKAPKSNWAVTGLYFYDNSVIDVASNIRPSARGELEITDVNKVYLERNALHVERLGRGTAWLDTGTPESMLQASNFIHVLEERTGLKVACLEEIAFRMGFITLDALAEQAHLLKKSEYGQYLARIVAEER